MELPSKCLGVFNYGSRLRQYRSQSYVITYPTQNEGTERDTEGVGWDMSMPLKLFLVLDENNVQRSIVLFDIVT